MVWRCFMKLSEQLSPDGKTLLLLLIKDNWLLWMLAARDCREGGWGGLLQGSFSFSWGRWESSGDGWHVGYITMNVFNTNGTMHFKWYTLCYVYYTTLFKTLNNCSFHPRGASAHPPSLRCISPHCWWRLPSQSMLVLSQLPHPISCSF